MQAGVSAGLTAGLASTSFMQSISAALQGSRFAQGAFMAVAGQLTSYTASRIAGVEASFSWRSIAVSAISAGLTSAAMSKIGPALGFDLATREGQFAADLVGGALGGSIAMHAGRKLGLGGDINYGRVMSDAFGNALGNGISGRHAHWAEEYSARLVAPAPQDSEPEPASDGVGHISAHAGYSDIGYRHGALMDENAPVRVPSVPADRISTMDPVVAKANGYGGWAYWSWSMDNNKWVNVNHGATFNFRNGHTEAEATIWSKPPITPNKQFDLDIWTRRALNGVRDFRRGYPVGFNHRMQEIGEGIYSWGKDQIKYQLTGQYEKTTVGKALMYFADEMLSGGKRTMGQVESARSTFGYYQQNPEQIVNQPWEAAREYWESTTPLQKGYDAGGFTADAVVTTATAEVGGGALRGLALMRETAVAARVAALDAESLAALRKSGVLDFGRKDFVANSARVEVAATREIVALDAAEVRLSQRTVSYNKIDRKTGLNYTYDDLVESMKTNGWKGDPVDVVRMPDGSLTSMDNTRITAAREAGIDVQAVVRGFDEPLTREMQLARTWQGYNTWGDAMLARIEAQGAKFRAANPYGSIQSPRITGRPK